MAKNWTVEAQFTIRETVEAESAADAMMLLGDRVREMSLTMNSGEYVDHVEITDMRVSIPKEKPA